MRRPPSEIHSSPAEIFEATSSRDASTCMRAVPSEDGPGAPAQNGDSICHAGKFEAISTEQSPRIGFWYSRKQALFIVAGLFLLVSVFGNLIPPFQSPDEFNHLKRAYLLSSGVLTVGNREHLTGGEIDSGLLQYMACFQGIPYNYGAKFETSTARTCADIHFTGARRFSSSPNTAIYFPLMYAPQALALWLGKELHLSVSNSYYLARLLASGATLGLLLWGMLIYPMPPAALGLFILPMCLFQLSSTSQDTISFATTVVSAALFLRGFHQELSFSARSHIALAICLFSLATSRLIYIALAPLLLVLYKIRRSPTYFVSFIFVLILSLVWIVFAVSTVHEGSIVSHETGSAEIVRFYVAHPSALFAVLFRTLTDGSILRQYWRMFVGIMGSLDTPLDSIAYLVFAAELVALALVSISVSGLRFLSTGHLALACAATASTLLLFLAALVEWTPHPARVIADIQGRYFYPIALLLLYSCWMTPRSRLAVTLSFAVLLAIAFSSVDFAVPKLVVRYYAQ